MNFVVLLDFHCRFLERERIYQSPAQLLDNLEPDSADILAFASAAEQTSLVLFDLYLALTELSKYKIYVNERLV